MSCTGRSAKLPISIACPAVQAQAYSLEQAAQRRAEGLNAELQEVTVQLLLLSQLRHALCISSLPSAVICCTGDCC